ncbi:MAG: MFS transporter [Planctomycetota bacterium]|nr:MAG: MFS transporter [Planctomycetota bacterium]
MVLVGTVGGGDVVRGNRNILDFRWGRLLTFFLLYVTEGVPLGFTATAIATQMRRAGVSVEMIGLFVGSLYLPWSFKWVAGPFVDLIRFGRFGHYRPWILTMQALMLLSLGAAALTDFVAAFALFTGLVFVHNMFGATQDVAIDALACRVLTESERGLANGMMFAGAYVGQILGGAGVLYLSGWLPVLHQRYGWIPDDFRATFVIPSLVIGGVALFVTFLVREPAEPKRFHAESDPSEAATGRGSYRRVVLAAVRELQQYVWTVTRTMFGSVQALLALAFALLPAGAFALSLSLQTNLAVELGLKDEEVSRLALYSGLISAGGCVLGGFLSDRLGRKRMLALFIVATTVPTLWFAAQMQRHGWVMPVPPDLPDRPAPPQALVAAFWTATLSFSFVHGLMFGTRTALFMDVVDPAVAATQFTAYMAVLNLTTSYTSAWQGLALAHWGYPTTLRIDALAGVLGIAVLPWLRLGAQASERSSEAGARSDERPALAGSEAD